jgi:RNA polymerase sigma-70 factor (ECF subfamily)
MADASSFEAAFRDAFAPSSAASRAALDTLCARARAGAPNAKISAAALAQFLRERVGPVDDPIAQLSKLHLADLSLAFACAQGDASAISAFRRDLVPRAAGAAAKVNRSPEFLQHVEDVLVQRLLVRAEEGPPRISTYAGRGTLASWVCAVAMRIAMDVSGKPSEPSAPSDASVDLALTREDPDLHFVRKQYQPAFKAAFEAAFAAMSPEDRNALRLSVMEGMSIDQLAALFGIHRSTAARRLARIRMDLLEATKLRLRQELKLSERETNSLLALLRSNLHLSLTRMFGAGHGRQPG